MIYFCRLDEGEIWSLTMYAKGARESIPASALRKIRESIHGQDVRKRSSKARR
jgi:hypothetical protein